MSEFKFACPVCGQHLTADSRASGTQLECPTCFQKLVVPQAPASPDGKLIVSAMQVGKPRPAQSDALWQDAVPIKARRLSLVSFVILSVAVCAAAGLLFLFRVELVRSVRAVTQRQAKPPPAPPVVKMTYPIATNVAWSLNLTNAVIPPSTASGGLHGSGFVCEKATLLGGILILHQGHSWPPDLGVAVHLFAKTGQELSGKTLEVTADRQPPLPKVTLAWKDEQGHSRTEKFYGGYALKLIFGTPAEERISGRIFLSLPDEAKSVVAGTFDAEIRKPPPPKPSQPQQAKPSG